MTTEKDDIWRP